MREREAARGGGVAASKLIRAACDCFFAIFVLAMTATGVLAQQEEWAGTYRCGAMKKDPDDRPGYSSSVKLTLKDGAATVVRDSGRIRETLSGKVADDGHIVLEGTGQLKDSGGSWRYRYEGRFEGTKFEATGAMYPPRGGAALRDCSMTLSRVSTSGERRAKAASPETKEPPAAAPPPAPVAVKVEPAPPPAPAPVAAKAEPAPPPLPAADTKAAPPAADVSPVVRAALEAPAAAPEQPSGTSFFARYSRTDLVLLAIFTVCAIAGVALVIYDWRRNRRLF